MLEEMGLTPVWRLRKPEDESAGESAPSIEPQPGRAPSAVAPDLTSVAGPQPRATVPPPRMTGREQRAAGEEPSLLESGERRAAIMAMGWAELKARVASCVDCPLHEKRTNTVFGVGDERADWMFVGEGPGAEEDAKGEPFVGQAGRLLDNMLPAIGLKRGRNAYICNVVKCRPPGNRNPEPGEALQCEPYLHRQIELIRPKLIVALGKVAAANLLATEASVASMRGRVHQYRGTPLIVTYHPAYLLRNLSDKAKAWEDLCFAVRVMRDLQEGAAAPTYREPRDRGIATGES